MDGCNICFLHQESLFLYSCRGIESFKVSEQVCEMDFVHPQYNHCGLTRTQEGRRGLKRTKAQRTSKCTAKRYLLPGSSVEVMVPKPEIYPKKRETISIDSSGGISWPPQVSAGLVRFVRSAPRSSKACFTGVSKRFSRSSHSS